MTITTDTTTQDLNVLASHIAVPQGSEGEPELDYMMRVGAGVLRTTDDEESK